MNKTLTIKEKIQIINKHPFFVLLQATDMKELAHIMTMKKIKRNSAIVKDGEIASKIYLIAEGAAELSRKITTLESSIDIPLGILVQYDAIGLSDEGFFSKSGRRTATVYALTDMILLEISVNDLNKFLRSKEKLYPGIKSPLENMKRLHFIKLVEPFAYLSVRDAQWLSKQLEEITIEKNQIVFQQGDVGDKCYLLKKGIVEVLLTDSQKNSSVLATLEPPAIFGEGALLIANATRNATIRTTEDCIFLTITRKQLLETMRRNQKSAEIISDIIIERGRPKHSPDIDIFQNKLKDNSTIFILKKNDTNKYIKLTNENYFIWNEIDGTKSTLEISEKFQKTFNKDNDTTLTTIKELAQKGFIQGIFLKENAHINHQTSLIKKLFAKIRHFFSSILK